MIFDKDVIMALGTLFFFLVLMIINDKFWNYKTGWRLYTGLLFISMGVMGIIVNTSNNFVISFFAGLSWIIIGSCIWLIKAKKEKKKK